MNISRRVFLGSATAAWTASQLIAAGKEHGPKIGVTDWNLKKTGDLDAVHCKNKVRAATCDGRAHRNDNRTIGRVVVRRSGYPTSRKTSPSLSGKTRGVRYLHPSRAAVRLEHHGLSRRENNSQSIR